MQKFTRTEISWIIKELDNVAGHSINAAGFKETTPAESALLTLKADNLYSITEKLQHLLNQGDKRIEVRP